MAIVPIVVGIMVLIWSMWFFGFEQSMTKRISNIEKAQGVEAIVLVRTMEKYKQLRQTINPATGEYYTDAEATEFAKEKVYKALMEKNGF